MTGYILNYIIPSNLPFVYLRTSQNLAIRIFYNKQATIKTKTTAILNRGYEITKLKHLKNVNTKEGD